MPEPTFKVKERKDYLKLKQMETQQHVSTGVLPNYTKVIQFSVDEYNKQSRKQNKEDAELPHE